MAHVADPEAMMAGLVERQAADKEVAVKVVAIGAAGRRALAAEILTMILTTTYHFKGQVRLAI